MGIDAITKTSHELHGVSIQQQVYFSVQQSAVANNKENFSAQYYLRSESVESLPKGPVIGKWRHHITMTNIQIPLAI